MEGALLFVLVIAAVIVLIAVINRRTELAREEEAEALARAALAEKAVAPKKEGTATTWSGTKHNEPEKAVKFNGQQQVNMYVYAPARRLQRCRCCDGENEIDAGFCRVCGMKLR